MDISLLGSMERQSSTKFVEVCYYTKGSLYVEEEVVDEEVVNP